MRMSKAIFVCVCLVGLTQLVWSQNKGTGAFQEKGIPGYLNPHTRTFTTRAQGSGVQGPEFTGTAVFFREQANITINNYDQTTNSLAICHADITSIGDANSGWYDSADVVATLSGGTWFCDVPVLTQWTLQTPATDQLELCVSVDIISLHTLGSLTEAQSSRSSSQPCLTITQPANGVTNVQTFGFQL